MTDPVRIARLGHRGDGIAETPDGPLYVAGALPGELVEVARPPSTSAPGKAKLLGVVEPSPERAFAFNPDVPACGGCGLRHLVPAAQLAWKRSLVADALGFAGIGAEIEPCVDAHGAGRRRATFHARMGADKAMRVGFMEAGSHAVVDLGEHDCPVLAPELKPAVEIVRALAFCVRGLHKPVDAVVTATLSGLDIDLRGLGRVPEALRLNLVSTALKNDLARLSVHGEILIEARAPLVRFGKAEVVLPPGGFLQATQAAEDALAALVLEGVGEARTVADLFSGSGTFSLRLAERARVTAVETDAASLAALDRAARNTAGLLPVVTERRDLFRRPLTAAELKGFDAVVFDPPRAGAEAQSRALAESTVRRAVAVSCAPAALGRDLRLLQDAGFRISRVIPVDQFRHSAHVEAVALLVR